MAWTSYELEFLPVGNGERSGDAIVARFVSDDGSWRTLVVDGGTKESGQTIVEHVRRHYGTNLINDVVNTHPDADHSSGLRVVFEEMNVGTLWMHRPWDHSFDIRHAFDDARLTGSSLASRMRGALVCAHELHELAEVRGVPRIEPFFGAQIGPFTVLAPTLPNYQALLPHFRCTPEPAKKPEAQPASLGDYLKDIFSRTAENWGIETLREGGQTSAENDSSVVMFAEVAGKGILLTGDAGVAALTNAMNWAPVVGVDLTNLGVIQIPHHGSRNNVSPSLLDRLVGTRLFMGGTRGISAIVSASAKSETHPRRVVTNAFKRRGCSVFQTKGNTHCNRLNMPTRPGWSVAEEVPFHADVEPYD
jgi:beta-lactamase superfamily II metal-dependent hydrolase